MERTAIFGIALAAGLSLGAATGQEAGVRFLDDPSNSNRTAPASYESTENPKAVPISEPPPTVVSPRVGPLQPPTETQVQPLPPRSLRITNVEAKPAKTSMVEPIAFLREIEPGVTTSVEALRVLGEPVVEKKTARGVRLTFQSPGFQTLTVEVADDKVARVQGELETPLSIPEFRKQWNIGETTAAMIPGANWQVVGQGFPERGLVAYFQPENRVAMISQIDLRPRNARLYLWRVQHGYDYGFQRRLVDVQEAALIDARNPETSWIRAELLLELDKPSEAFNEIEAALAISVDTARYRITRGRAFAALGDNESAAADFQAIAESESATLLERAQAETGWGKLFALGQSPDYPASMSHHQKAINLAVKAARENGPLAARKIQKVLIDAHLGGARAVALGPWKGGQQAALQWIAKANAFAGMYVEREKGDPIELVRTQRKVIELYDVMNRAHDPSEMLTQCANDGDALIAKTDDKASKRQIEWELAQAYFRGARLLRRQGKMEAVNKYYTRAYELVKDQEDTREATPTFNYFMGNVYFFAGSLYAVNQEDHAKALPIYDRALQYYGRTLGPGMLAESGLHGERYVSMGVTYWQANRRDQAVALSEAGLQLMENASGRGALPRSELAVPYANLAHMKSEMGDKESASKYLKVSAQIEATQRK